MAKIDVLIGFYTRNNSVNKQAYDVHAQLVTTPTYWHELNVYNTQAEALNNRLKIGSIDQEEDKIYVMVWVIRRKGKIKSNIKVVEISTNEYVNGNQCSIWINAREEQQFSRIKPDLLVTKIIIGSGAPQPPAK